MGQEKTYSVGLVGTGQMAKKHIDTLAVHPRIRFSAIHHTARAAQTAAEWQTRYGFTSTTADFEQFLTTPDLNLVWICSPNDQHFTQTERALKAGKHVFCEKPLAVSANEAEYLSRLAQESKRTLAVGMNCRFRSQYVTVKRLLESGTLGRLFLIRGTYLYNSAEAIRNRLKPWLLDKANQPLLLTSGLIHTLDLMIWMAGEVTEVTALGGATVLNGAVGDDTLLIGLRFEKGVIGELAASMVTVRPNDLSLEVYGEGGSVIRDTLIVRDQAFRESRLEISQPILDLGLQLENILAALDGHAFLMNDSARAARNLRVCEAIQQALTLGRTVTVNYGELQMALERS